MRITVGDRAVDFPQGTVWKDVAERFQGEYPREILLAKVGPRLYELHSLFVANVQLLYISEKIGVTGMLFRQHLHLVAKLTVGAGY